MDFPTLFFSHRESTPLVRFLKTVKSDVGVRITMDKLGMVRPQFVIQLILHLSPLGHKAAR